MGKWIDYETDASTGKPYLWKCDECGEEVETRWNYCPECGDPKTSKGKSIGTLVKALEAEHKRLKELQNLATDKNVGTKETIYRQDAIDALTKDKEALEHSINGMSGYEKEFDRFVGQRNQVDCDIYAIEQLPPEQPEIIHCKDCAKHNKGVGDFEVLPDGKRSWIWKDQACPLVSWRGKAQGHEFDYQYCACAERRTDERSD